MRRDAVLFFSVEEVVLLHDDLLARTPESQPGMQGRGVAGVGGHGAQERLRGHARRPRFRVPPRPRGGHAFNDGNKRTALATASMFLAMNGHRVTVTGESEDLTVAAAARLVGRETLELHLAALMGGDEPVED